jgi:glycosyltransferase involved in cell wall biosynthesis
LIVSNSGISAIVTTSAPLVAANGAPHSSGRRPPVLAIVVPCYNEQEVLSESATQFDALLQRLVDAGKIAPHSRITFVDDGSRDGTWSLIEKESVLRRRVSGIKLSRNRGHQNAVLAGMMMVEGDAVVTIDADLQDDIGAIETMLDAYANGCDIVYGVRADRSSDTLFKRSTAVLFYRLLAFAGVELVHNHADFRLMSRRAVEALREYREGNLYLRGIVPQIGFQSTCVEYVRKERFAGESKYPFVKMVKLAVEAITSFSTAPLQLITALGFAVFCGAMIVSGWVLWTSLYTDRAVPGWASTVLPLYFLAGVHILCIGVIGAYLGKVYSEVKARPRFFIDRTTKSMPLASMEIHVPAATDTAMQGAAMKPHPAPGEPAPTELRRTRPDRVMDQA